MRVGLYRSEHGSYVETTTPMYYMAAKFCLIALDVSHVVNYISSDDCDKLITNSTCYAKRQLYIKQWHQLSIYSMLIILTLCVHGLADIIGRLSIGAAYTFFKCPSTKPVGDEISIFIDSSKKSAGFVLSLQCLNVFVICMPSVAMIWYVYSRRPTTILPFNAKNTRKEYITTRQWN